MGNRMSKLLKKRAGLVEKLRQADQAIANEIAQDVYEIIKQGPKSWTKICDEMGKILGWDSRLREDEHVYCAIRSLLARGLIKVEDDPDFVGAPVYGVISKKSST